MVYNSSLYFSSNAAWGGGKNAPEISQNCSMNSGPCKKQHLQNNNSNVIHWAGSWLPLLCFWLLGCLCSVSNNQFLFWIWMPTRKQNYKFISLYKGLVKYFHYVFMCDRAHSSCPNATGCHHQCWLVLLKTSPNETNKQNVKPLIYTYHVLFFGNPMFYGLFWQFNTASMFHRFLTHLLPEVIIFINLIHHL